MDFRTPAIHASPNVGTQAASVVQIESNKLVGLLVVVGLIAVLLASVALGLSIGARDLANKAERESRLQRLETDELRAALSRAGIRTHDDTDNP